MAILFRFSSVSTFTFFLLSLTWPSGSKPIPRTVKIFLPTMALAIFS